MKDVDRIVLTHPCIYCGADPQEWCVTRNGYWAKYLHSARWWAAKDAGDLDALQDTSDT